LKKGNFEEFDQLIVKMAEKLRNHPSNVSLSIIILFLTIDKGTKFGFVGTRENPNFYFMPSNSF